MQRKCCSHCPLGVEEPVPVPQPTASCIERFATAKKFHAENLQHQPLPDRVDDAIFRAGVGFGLDDDPCMLDAVKRLPLYLRPASFPSSPSLLQCYAYCNYYDAKQRACTLLQYHALYVSLLYVCVSVCVSVCASVCACVCACDCVGYY
jgi:hypothetical protein